MPIEIVRLYLWNKRRKRDSNRTMNTTRCRIWITLIDRKCHCFNAELTHKCSTSYSNNDGWPKIAEVDGLTPFQMPYPHHSIYIFVKPSKQSYSLSPKKSCEKTPQSLPQKNGFAFVHLLGHSAFNALLFARLMRFCCSHSFALSEYLV